MSGVIKLGDGAGLVRGLMSRSPPPPLTADARRIADLEARLTEAEGVIVSLREAAASLAIDVETARREGRAEGRIEGRKSADDGAADRLRVLGEAAAAAERAFQDALEELQTSAGDLAALALGRIVGDVAARVDLVAGTVRVALTETFKESVVRVEVARADFPDAEAVRSLDLARIAPSVDIRVAPDLTSGGCRIQLKLGEVDLGLDGQVARLRAVLETSAAPE